MTKETIMNVLKKDEADGNGVIVSIDDEKAVYLDFDTDMEIPFRYAECCTDDWLKNLIHIGESAKIKGLTEDFVVDVIKKAFQDDFANAVCNLSGIIIPTDEIEFKQMLDICMKGSNNYPDEWYSWDETQSTNCVGRLFSVHHIIFINEPKINNLAHDLSMDLEPNGFHSEYCAGILVTLLHEIRYLMLDSNLFLPEDIYPEEIKEEDEVEMFARNAYDNLGDLKEW